MMTADKCSNCGREYSSDQHILTRCPECYWPRGKEADQSKPFCSVCRRRHGEEVQHGAE